MADNLNAAQLQAIEQKARDGLGHAIHAMNLRKWAVEQAIEIGCSPNLATKIEVITLAAQIYAFVAKPAIEFKVEP